MCGDSVDTPKFIQKIVVSFEVDTESLEPFDLHWIAEGLGFDLCEHATPVEGGQAAFVDSIGYEIFRRLLSVRRRSMWVSRGCGTSINEPEATDSQSPAIE